jgi:pimeloyl-ACP methyl ester carboxylesterase
MPLIAVREVEHYYEWVTASGDEIRPTGNKPVLVFIHGWAGSTRYWKSTAQNFTDRYDCLLYDLRGFGQSRLPRPLPDAVQQLGYELEGYADDLAIFLDQLGVDRVVLNAHSTGASIAVLFAAQYPDRVEQVILTCHGVFEYNALAFKAFHQVGGYVVAFRPAWLKQIPAVDRMFMARFLKQPIPAADRKAFLEDFLIADQEAALGTIYTAVSEKAAIEMPQAYAKITVPTLLISGEFDQIIPVKLGKKAAAFNPQVKHVIMPNTGHFPMLEDRATYLQQVSQFLSSNSQG